MQFLLVFVGGGAGSIVRFGIAKAVAPYAQTFPLATLLANLLSCILLGFLAQLSLKNQLSEPYKWLLMTGFCGGFSTFSTFSNDTFALFEAGQFWAAGLNIVGSILSCLAAIAVGLWLGRCV